MTSKVNLNDYAYFLERLQYHIDLDADEYIEHFGIKGMRWGVRKDRSESAPLKSLGPDKVVTTTKNGTTLTLQKDSPTVLHKTFAKLSKNYRESYSKSANFDITVNDGQKIGTGMVDLKSKDELYLNWIQIDTSARGNGYATAALKAAIDFGKDSGVKKLTLEVPGNAPDARHIYEKLGFKVTKEADETDGVWGGLTEMEYSLDSAAQSSFSRYVIHGIKDVSLDSLRKSQWEVFDPEFAKMIKEEHPDIWDEGGNIKGNDQYEILSKIFEQGGTAKTDSQIAAIELREAWVARHEQDFRLPGVIAQIKWLAVGSRGEAYMKKLVRDEIKKRTSMENSDIDISMEDFIEHLNIKKTHKKGATMTPDEIGEYLEHQGATDEEIDDFLEHFGVKGMRWGVRKQNALDRANRVAEGKGTRGDKVRVALRESAISTRRAGTIERLGRNQANDLQGLKDRTLSGKNTAGDYLNRIGGMKIINLGVKPTKAEKLEIKSEIARAKELKRVEKGKKTSDSFMKDYGPVLIGVLSGAALGVAANYKMDKMVKNYFNLQ